MFGHVQANLADFREDGRQRYHSRLSLTYDLTFLTLLLSSLYEPSEKIVECRCVVHLCKELTFMRNECTDYAADMTIALTYYKCLDDWKDDKNLLGKCYATTLAKQYEWVKKDWLNQCAAIETSLFELSIIEKGQSGDDLSHIRNAISQLESSSANARQLTKTAAPEDTQADH